MLRELKLDAEAHFGRPVSKAVITVPAYFNDGQRQATKDAGRIAGLDVLRILNEPTAAALAYGFGKHGQREDRRVRPRRRHVRRLACSRWATGVFDVIATGGDTYLGGEDFDNRIIEWLVMSFAKEHGVDLRKDRMALQRLKDAAERAKIELSDAEGDADQPALPLHARRAAARRCTCRRTLTREKLEELTQDLVERTRGHRASRCSSEAKVQPGDLKEIILVGGMTRMPRCVEAVSRHFQRDPCKGVHPEEVVALGAAIQADALTQPESAGAAAGRDARRAWAWRSPAATCGRCIPKNTTVPTSATELLQHLQGRPDHGEDHGAAGRERARAPERAAGRVHPHRAARGAARARWRSRSPSRSTPRASSRCPRGTRRPACEQSITVTASGGLTEDELKSILEQQADSMLEARVSSEVEQKRNALTSAAAEVSALIPRVRQLTGSSEFGREALRRAEEVIASARAAAESADLAALTDWVDQLERTRVLFVGVLERLGARQ